MQFPLCFIIQSLAAIESCRYLLYPAHAVEKQGFSTACYLVQRFLETRTGAQPMQAPVNAAATRCPACEEPGTAPFVDHENYRFYSCAGCGFVFLNPMPAQRELNLLYREEKTAAEPTYDKASSRLRRAYLKLPRFLPYAWNRDVLDLGCGGGFIAHVLSLVARSATGIDINPSAIGYASRRFPRPTFLCSELSDVLNLRDRFDFVHCSELIEHVGDVNLFMRALKTLTRPGGHVYITTPDRGHHRVPADIREWDVFCPPVHVQFFTRRAAEALFGRYGFRIVQFYSNRKPGLLFVAKNLDGYYGSSE